MRNFAFKDTVLALGKYTYIMGILNVTPDSFSDGGKYNTLTDALKQTEKLISDGADIIDIGAVSTRPFSTPVTPAEEWERLSEVLRNVLNEFRVPVSVDTYNVSTAEKCLAAGADIINDVSGMCRPDMASLVKEYNAGWVLMHGGVLLTKTEAELKYEKGIIADVQKFFDSTVQLCDGYGTSPENLCLDPGFGFAKNTAQNTELLNNFNQLDSHSAALMCALSNKRFIGELSEVTAAAERTGGTLAANITAAEKGADIIRVHEVKLHRQAMTFLNNIR